MPNIFISLALKAIKDSSDIVLFSGKTTKRLLDQPLHNLPAMVSLNGKVRTRTWSDIASLVNQTYASYNGRSIRGVHVHNEHKLGDFLEHVIVEHRKSLRNKRKRRVEPINRLEMHSILDARQAPIVVTNSADENWGFLSTGIGTRTTMWINMTNHLLIHGANYDTVQHFLDSDKILLVVCNTHVDPSIGAHKKIISLPLGVSRKGPVLETARRLSALGVKKKTVLQINNSGWGDRAFINRIVTAAFNGTVQNTYAGANTDEMKTTAKKRKSNVVGVPNRRLQDVPVRDYYREAAEARFVLCPSGLGYDTYRLWETLLMGSIPIVESNAGFDRTYSNLPVLVVRNFSDVTPALLDRAFPCFVEHADKFLYIHLTERYWLDLIARAVINGNIDHVTENHPFRNKYCSFL